MDSKPLPCRDRAGDREGAGTACGETLSRPEHTSGPGKECGASVHRDDTTRHGGRRQGGRLQGWDDKSVHLVREQVGV